METFDSLIAEYQLCVSDLELSYRNFKTSRVLGTAGPDLDLMREKLEAKEQYLKSLLDQINKICVDGTCRTSEASS